MDMDTFPDRIEGGAGPGSLRLLFVTWDGPGLAYLQSLFLPIFAGLRPYGIAVDVLQFRWGPREQTEEIARQCAAVGCGYRSVTIRRWPGGIGPIASALVGALSIRAAARHFGSQVIMPRSLMPAMATLAAGGARFRPIVFDADGLAADERVEFAGLNPQGVTYRLLRDVEAQAVRQADSVIVRSPAAATILHARAGPSCAETGFHVVTNGRDERHFTPGSESDRVAIRRELGIDAGAPVIVYAGSVGPQYCFDTLADFVTAVRSIDPRVRLLVLTGAGEQARAALAEQDPETAAAAIIRSVAPDRVSRYLAAGDVGIAYRQPSFANRGVAPIKLSEYLLCGLPIVGTAAVGDTAAAVAAGVFHDNQGAAIAARWFSDTVMPDRAGFRDRARDVGIHSFSLEQSIRDYLAALEPLRRFGLARMEPADHTDA